MICHATTVPVRHRGLALSREGSTLYPFRSHMWGVPTSACTCPESRLECPAARDRTHNCRSRPKHATQARLLRRPKQGKQGALCTVLWKQRWLSRRTRFDSICSCTTNIGLAGLGWRRQVLLRQLLQLFRRLQVLRALQGNTELKGSQSLSLWAAH